MTREIHIDQDKCVIRVVDKACQPGEGFFAVETGAIELTAQDIDGLQAICVALGWTA